MKASNFYLGIIIFLVLLNFVSAEIKIQSKVDCTGECEIKQSYNGDSVEVKASGNTKMTTRGDSGKAEVAVDTEGEVKISIKDESNPKIVMVDDLPDPVLFNNSFSGGNCFSCGAAGGGNDDTHNLSGNESAGNGSEESQEILNETAGIVPEKNDSIEAMSLAGERKEETRAEEIFQKFYSFFQKVTARLWIW